MDSHMEQVLERTKLPGAILFVNPREVASSEQTIHQNQQPRCNFAGVSHDGTLNKIDASEN